MSAQGVEYELTELLEGMNRRGGYPLALICTEQGLLIASAGERLRSEITAGITGLFDDIAIRASRDLGLGPVDEFTISAGKSGHLVVRSLGLGTRPRLFLVVQVPTERAWRRNTATVARKIRAIMSPLLAIGDKTL